MPVRCAWIPVVALLLWHPAARAEEAASAEAPEVPVEDLSATEMLEPAAPAPIPLASEPLPQQEDTDSSPAEDALILEEHPMALGAHTHMSGAFLAAYSALPGTPVAMNPWLNLSFMYRFSPSWAIDVFAGFVVGSITHTGGANTAFQEGDASLAFELAVGPRALYTIVSGTRTRLYTGLGAAALIAYQDSRRTNSSGGCPGGACGGFDAYGFAVAAPLGFEYRFESVPRLIFSAEVNLHVAFMSVGQRYEDTPDGKNLSTPNFNQVIVGLGNPPRAGTSGNFIDYLSFVTMGFHYLL